MFRTVLCTSLVLMTAVSLQLASIENKLQSSFFLQQDPDLSKEITDYIMGDVESGAADPMDAYANIQDMIADGTILESDGDPALEKLNSMINEMPQINSEFVFLQQDPDLSKEITDYIMGDVENGAADPMDAYANIQDMIADGTILQSDGDPALEKLNSIINGSSSAESQLVLLQQDPDLSKEITDYIMGDVENGAADPMDAYANIQDMIADGTILQSDGDPALEKLNSIINGSSGAESQVVLLQQDPDLSKEITDYIMGDVENGAADPMDAYANIQDMIADGTILQSDGDPALEKLNGIINQETMPSETN